MHDGSPSFQSIVAAAMLAAGIAMGLAHFRVLRWTIERGGTRPVVLHAAASLARLFAAALFFGFAARLGALPLLAAFMGFLLARAHALHGARRAD